MAQIWQFALLGLTTGGAYALMGLGIVATYRGSGVLNFAQGAIGTAGAYVFWTLFHSDGLPLAAAIASAVLLGAGIGAAFYALTGRLLDGASEVAKTLVTLGLVLALQGVIALIYGTLPILVLPFLANGSTTVLGATVLYSALMVVAVGLALTVGLALAFDKTKFGRATTALRDSPMGAQALGYSPHPWGIATWAGGGALAVIAGVLLAPVTSLSTSNLMLLVVPGLGAALLARLRSFGIAFGAAMAMGIAQSIVISYTSNPGYAYSIPSVVTLAVIVIWGRGLPGRQLVVPRRLFRLGSGRIQPVRLGLATVAIIAIALLLPFVWSDALTTSAVFALVGLSVVACTGYTGQVSLAPFALVGVASLAAAHASSAGAPFVIALLAGVGVALAVGLLVGAPSVRARGAGLTIATAALALIIENSVFTSSFLTGVPDGITVHPPNIFGYEIDTGTHPQRYALFAWFLVLVGGVALANLRRSRAGRRLISVRSNERGAAALGVSVGGAKLAAFAISSAFAGLAGVLLTFQTFSVGGYQFGANYTFLASLTVVATTVLVSAGYVTGGVLAGVLSTGGLFTQVFSFFTGINSYLPIIFGLNLLVVYVHNPDGFLPYNIEAVRSLRARVARRFERTRPGPSPAPTPRAWDGAPRTASSALRPARPLTAGDVPLAARDIEVRYGGITAVDRVSLDLHAGEVVGILGPNGAGKSTLIDALTGFVPVTRGRVSLAGRDITRLRPYQRARLGMVRTFQEHLLFEDISVRENLLAASERRDTGAYISGLARPAPEALPGPVAAAAELLGIVGYLDTLVADLSTGWRARVAVARAVASRPGVICLDEPAAGLSEDSRREMSAVIRALAHQLGLGVLLVEHNIDVVLDTCDTVIVLDFGSVLASGAPHEVLAQESVKRAYLGEEVEPAEAEREVA